MKSSKNVKSVRESEIAHKVSERIAFLLANEVEERFKIFKLVKKIYRVRSTIVHGGQLHLSEDIIELALELEYLVQRILKTIILSEKLRAKFSSKQSVKEEFLTSLLFSKPL